MELSAHILWMITGGFIGASLTSLVFLFLLFIRRQKIPPKPKPSPVEIKKLVTEGLPTFKVTNLQISPTQAQEGEIITVTAQVTNVGGAKGNYSATLILDGRIIATRGVTLEAGSTIPVTFTITERQGGKHTVEVDGLKGEFFIPPANFSLSDLTISPPRVKEGEKVTVSVRITNTGGTTGSHLVELKIKDVTERTQEITLPPNSSQIVNFDIVKKRPGFYPIKVGNLEGKIIVEMSDEFEAL